MNGPCNQFLAGTRLSKNQYAGIGRRHALDLAEHGLQTSAAAYDLFGSAITMSLFNQTQFRHTSPPRGKTWGSPANYCFAAVRAARIFSSKFAASKGLSRKSTAPSFRALWRVSESSRAEIKITGSVGR